MKELNEFVEFLKKSGYLTAAGKDVIKEYEKSFPEKFKTKKEIKKEEKKLPDNFDEAVEYYMDYFKKFDREIKNMPEEAFATFYQAQLCEKIKNQLNLWNKDSELFKSMKKKFKTADEMTDAIIRGIYKKYRKNKK